MQLERQSTAPYLDRRAAHPANEGTTDASGELMIEAQQQQYQYNATSVRSHSQRSVSVCSMDSRQSARSLPPTAVVAASGKVNHPRGSAAATGGGGGTMGSKPSSCAAGSDAGSDRPPTGREGSEIPFTDWPKLNIAVSRHSYQHSVTHLAISSVVLDDDSWIWLCRILPMLAAMKILDLSNTAMNDERCKMLIGETKSSAGVGSPLFGLIRSKVVQLETIDWCHNLLTHRSANTIGKLVRRQCNSLAFFNLRGNKLGDHGLQQLGSHIQVLFDICGNPRGPSLRSLDISRNRGSTRGLVDLLASCSASQSIEHLVMYDNGSHPVVSQDGGSSPYLVPGRSPSMVSQRSWSPRSAMGGGPELLLAPPPLQRESLHGMVCPNALRTIDLSRCHLGTENICEMIRVIFFSCISLTELYLAGNDLTDEIGAEFVDCTRSLEFLSVLDLSDNPIGTETASLLTHSVVALQKAQRLQTLNFANTDITLDGVLNLVQMTVPDTDGEGNIIPCALPSLISIDVTFGNLSGGDCRVLKEILHNSPGCTVRFGPPRDGSSTKMFTQHTPRRPTMNDQQPSSPPQEEDLQQQQQLPNGDDVSPSGGGWMGGPQQPASILHSSPFPIAGETPPPAAQQQPAVEQGRWTRDSQEEHAHVIQMSDAHSVAQLEKPPTAPTPSAGPSEDHLQPAPPPAATDRTDSTVLDSGVISQTCSPIRAERTQDVTIGDDEEEQPMLIQVQQPTEIILPDDGDAVPQKEEEQADSGGMKTPPREADEEKGLVSPSDALPSPSPTEAAPPAPEPPVVEDEAASPPEEKAEESAAAAAVIETKPPTPPPESPTTARERLRARREKLRKNRMKRMVEIWQHSVGHIICHAIHLEDKESLTAAITEDLDRILHDGSPSASSDGGDDEPRTTVDIPDWDAGALMTIHTQTTESFASLRARLRKATSSDFTSVQNLVDLEGDTLYKLVHSRYEAVGDTALLDRIDDILHDHHGIEQQLIDSLPPEPEVATAPDDDTAAEEAHPRSPSPSSSSSSTASSSSTPSSSEGTPSFQLASGAETPVPTTIDVGAPADAVPANATVNSSSSSSGLVHQTTDEAIIIEPDDAVWSLPLLDRLPDGSVATPTPANGPTIFRIVGIARPSNVDVLMGAVVPTPPVSTLAGAAAAELLRRQSTLVATSLEESRNEGGPSSVRPGWMTAGTGGGSMVNLTSPSNRLNQYHSLLEGVTLDSGRSTPASSEVSATAAAAGGGGAVGQNMPRDSAAPTALAVRSPSVMLVPDINDASRSFEDAVQADTTHEEEDQEEEPAHRPPPVPAVHMLPFSETMLERKRSTHTPTSRETSPAPSETRERIVTKTAHMKHLQQQVKKNFAFCREAVAAGTLNLPKGERNKIRICQGRMSRFDVTLSVEWDNYLVMKNRVGVATKDVVLVHPLQAVEEGPNTPPLVREGIGNSIIITLVRPRHLMDSSNDSSAMPLSPTLDEEEGSKRRRRTAFSPSDMQVFQVQLKSREAVAEAIATLNAALQASRDRMLHAPVASTVSPSRQRPHTGSPSRTAAGGTGSANNRQHRPPAAPPAYRP